MAIAILGWPIDKLAPEIAREGYRRWASRLSRSGDFLAGGHSIDAPEPIFGLAVTGVVPVSKIKKTVLLKQDANFFN